MPTDKTIDMNTPMRELIEEIDSMIKYSNEEHAVGLNAAQNKARNLLPLEEAMMKEVWEAAKEGSIQRIPVITDQYGSVNIEKHFVCKNPDFNQFISQYNKK